MIVVYSVPFVSFGRLDGAHRFHQAIHNTTPVPLH